MSTVTDYGNPFGFLNLDKTQLAMSIVLGILVAAVVQVCHSSRKRVLRELHGHYQFPGYVCVANLQALWKAPSADHMLDASIHQTVIWYRLWSCRYSILQYFGIHEQI